MRQAGGSIIGQSRNVFSGARIVIDYGDKPLPPIDIKVVKNTIVGTLVEQAEGENITWKGNVLYSKAAVAFKVSKPSQDKACHQCSQRIG
jgi:hypothetical protein